MSKLHETIQAMVKHGMHPRKTVTKTMDATGKKAIGCFPVYVPEVIVYAGGFLPIGMWVGKQS